MPSRRSVFLSYRRQETSHLAGRLADRLVSKFGEAHVFMDVDSIAPGSDFGAAIERAVNECAVLLALIGPTWISAVDAHGRRRLDDPDDLVVLELQAALDRAVPVIPVLVDGAEAPTRDDLPQTLSALARRQALRIDHDTFRGDCAGLLRHVTRIVDKAVEKDTKVNARPSDDNAHIAPEHGSDDGIWKEAHEAAQREQGRRERQASPAHPQQAEQIWQGREQSAPEQDRGSRPPPMQWATPTPQAGSQWHPAAGAPFAWPAAPPAHAASHTLAEGGRAAAGHDREPAGNERRRRLRVAIAAAAAAALAVTVGVIVFVSQPAATTDPGTATIPNPATADPCSLLDTGSVKEFGLTSLDPDNASFAECRADIKRPDGGGVGLTIGFENYAQVATIGGAERWKEDGYAIVRYPPRDGLCQQRMLLADGNAVLVSAWIYNDPTGTTDVCAIADASRRTATLARLVRDGIGQRVPLSVNSPLAGIPACSLLSQEEVVASLVNPMPAVPHFGDWSCHWNSLTSKDSVQVSYYRDHVLDESDGAPATFAGHPGTVLTREGHCEAQIVQRSYAVGGSNRIERVSVEYWGFGTGDQYCQAATALATAAAGRLPPPS